MSNLKRHIILLADKTISELLFFFMTLFGRRKINKLEVNNCEIRDVLIIRPGGIGDFLLSIPFYRKIRVIFPNAKIHLFLFKRSLRCLEIYSAFNSITMIDNPFNFFAFILKKKKYQIVFDLDQKSKMPAILAFLSGAKIRVGFDTNSRRKAYTHLTCYRQNLYEAENFLNELKWFGEFKFNYKDLIIAPKKSKRVDAILKSGRNIGIYAAAMKPENRMSLERWKNILKEEGYSNIYLIGGKKDQKFYNSFEKKLKLKRIIRIDGKLSLSEAFYLISKLEKLYAVDGGVLHLAVCAGTPTESYWGPSIMEKWKPNQKIHKGIKSKMSCMPCTYGRFAEFRGCPYQLRCMKKM